MRTAAKPVIGVVADLHAGGKHVTHCAGQKYLDAVSAGANAIVFILPALIDKPGACWTDSGDFSQVLGMLDGLFLTGAVSNVAPARYGAALLDPSLPADPARDHASLGLARAAIAFGMPVLGVCRGFQEINVALGGTLHQAVHEVPGFDDHRERGATLAEHYAPAHDVRFGPGGMLRLLTGHEGARVNSLHGQGIDRLAPGLVADAVAPDGLIEAFRAAGGQHFLLGLQWHPEWEFREDPISVMIFRAFGEAARAYHASRRRLAPAA
jgi:putative glutamine amidotransferase